MSKFKLTHPHDGKREFNTADIVSLAEIRPEEGTDTTMVELTNGDFTQVLETKSEIQERTNRVFSSPR